MSQNTIPERHQLKHYGGVVPLYPRLVLGRLLKIRNMDFVCPEFCSSSPSIYTGFYRFGNAAHSTPWHISPATHSGPVSYEAPYIVNGKIPC